MVEISSPSPSARADKEPSGQSLPIRSRHARLSRKTSNWVRHLAYVGLLLGLFMGSGYLGLRIAHTFIPNGQAIWVSTNGQSYLSLEAETPYSLGYLTGWELSGEINRLKLLLLLTGAQIGVSYRQMLDYSEVYTSFIPPAQLQEMEGIRDGVIARRGIPFSLQDVVLQNCWLDLYYGQILPSTASPMGCTCIMFTANGSTPVGGQNFDFTGMFTGCMQFVVHTLGDQPAIFSLRIGAGLCLPCGKNANNVTVLTSVIASTQRANATMPVFCRTRLAFQEATNASEFLAVFLNDSNNGLPLAFTLSVADENSAFAIDVLPSQYSLSVNQMLVRTNTFANPLWQPFLMNVTYSKDRQAYAELLVQNASLDGEMNCTELLAILQDTPIICRSADRPQETATLAFFCPPYFGLGNPLQSSLGWLPI